MDDLTSVRKDDLASVRELAADPPPPTDEARAAARARLQSAITRETREGIAVALPRRLLFRAAIAATAAAAVAGTTVVAVHGKDSNDAPRMTTLSAAQVLHKAADRSRSDSADLPIPRNDQYLYTKEVTTRTWLKSGKVEKFTDESWLSVDGSKTSRYSYEGRILDEPPLGKHHVRWPPTEYAKLKKWPTDPDKLLKALRRGGDGSDMADQIAFMDAVMLMRGPRVMPPGLQAAAFEAVAKLPDIVIDHDEVDALGRHGIGISYPKTTFGLVFDRDTYAYLGLRQTGSTSGGTKYKQVKGLVKAAVVDKLGQRP
ncbi:CU044_5270 family protein [Streptomyces sp. NPDC050564]|uniref:CU044_5270 family protein n=1 Tax=Streptomyces sp. NPDC050564 TaxID=3365631 RepID=UPI0037B81667